MFQSYPEYSFSYGVKDPHTGDEKHQWEKRKGDHVEGRYSLVEPDGSIRVVDYTADDKHGFNAIVKNTGAHQHSSDGKSTSHSEVYFHTSGNANYAYSTNGDSKANTFTEHHTPSVDHEQLSQDVSQHYHNYGGSTQLISEEHQSPDLSQETYYYADNTELASNHNSTAITTKHQYPQENESRTKHEHVLPIDLSLLNKNNQKLIPLEVSVLKPTEIDLTKVLDPYANKKQRQPYLNLLKNKNVQYLVSNKEPEIDLSLLNSHGQVEYESANRFVESPAQQISQPDLNYYLKQNKHFYGQENSYLEPVYENDFKPIIPKKTTNIIPTNRPGLIKTNKKPHTTPGLRNYSTSRGYLKYIFPPKQPNHSQNQRPHYYYNPKGPILFPPNPDDRKTEVPKLYQRTANNGYLRYAKHVNYYK